MTLNKSEMPLPTDYGLDALSAILHEAASEKGFWQVSTPQAFSEKLGYVSGEIENILEAIKNKGESEEIVSFFVMILIRILDLYAAMRNVEFVEHSIDELLIRQIENNKAIIASLHNDLN